MKLYTNVYMNASKNVKKCENFRDLSIMYFDMELELGMKLELGLWEYLENDYQLRRLLAF